MGAGDAGLEDHRVDTGMIRSARQVASTLLAASLWFILYFSYGAGAEDAGCGPFFCPDVGYAPGALTASHVSQVDGQWVASNETVPAASYRYRLQSPCAVDAAAGGNCRPDDDALCSSPPDRVVQVMVVQQQAGSRRRDNDRRIRSRRRSPR